MMFYVLILKLFGLTLTFKLMETGEVNAVELYSKMMKSPKLEEAEREFVKEILEGN